MSGFLKAAATAGVICSICSVFFPLAGQENGEISIDIVAEPPAEVETMHIDSTGDDNTGDAVDTLPPLDKEPVLKKFVEIMYPPELAKEGVSGIVTVDLLVNENGRVDSLSVIKGVHSLLDSLVADAVKGFLFEPAVAQGETVPVILTYEYRITLDAVVDSIQEYVNFSGVVLERGTRNPIPGAYVTVSIIDTASDTLLPVPFSMYIKKIGSFDGQDLEGNSLVTLTDSIGRFAFRSLPAGSCVVHIPVVGYEAFVSDEMISHGELLEVTYRLQKVMYSDYEIVVYGKSEKREVARRTLSVSEVRKIPGFGGDAVKVVQALPGVARPSFGGGTVVVRGAPTWDSKFYLDGVPIPQLYHFGGVKSTYNSEALESIDFYPGGFSSRFGGAIAGVVELQGRGAKEERLHGFGDVSLLDATAFIETPLSEKVSVLATARRSYIGDLLGFATEKLSIIELPVTVAPFYYDYVVRTDVRLNREQRFFGTLFGSKDAFELIVPFLRRGSSEVDSLADRIRQMNRFTMGIAGWDLTSPSGFDNSLRASLTYNDGFGSIFGFAKFDYSAWEYTLRNETGYRFGDRLKINAGIELWYMDFTQDAIFPNPDNTLFKTSFASQFGLAGPYLTMEYRPISRLLLVPGIRIDYYRELDYNGSLVPEFWDYRGDRYRRGISGEPSLRVSARYEINEGSTIKTAVGTYNQTPQPQGFTTSKDVGNPHLPATRARHVVAGFEQQFTDLIFLDIQLYHNQQWGIPEFASSADLLADPDGPRILPDGEGRMYGLELLLRHDNSERFFGWVAYTLARSERYNRKEKRYSLYNRDQTHNLQLVASYRFPRQWEAGARLRYVTGNPQTPIIGSVYDATRRFYRPVTGPQNSMRNGPFFQLDVRVDRKFVFDSWMFSLYLDLQNVLVFAYQSPEFTVYNYDFSEQTAISTPFIPSLGMRAEF